MDGCAPHTAPRGGALGQTPGLNRRGELQGRPAKGCWRGHKIGACRYRHDARRPGTGQDGRGALAVAGSGAARRARRDEQVPQPATNQGQICVERGSP
jgi:hypothetical protein